MSGKGRCLVWEDSSCCWTVGGVGGGVVAAAVVVDTVVEVLRNAEYLEEPVVEAGSMIAVVVADADTVVADLVRVGVAFEGLWVSMT